MSAYFQISCLSEQDKNVADKKQLMKLMLAVNLEKCNQQNLTKLKFALFQISENNLAKVATEYQLEKIKELVD